MLAGLILAAPLVIGSLAPQRGTDPSPYGGGVIDDRPRPAQGTLEIPRNDGWVTDLAGLLTTSEEREIEALAESYKRGTTHEIAVLTVPNLKGRPIEEFGLQVFRSWGIGGKDASNGALLVVSKEDRLVRIEVGGGLEGSLPDVVCGRIIRNVITPEFKRGRFGAGIKNGVIAIHEAVGGKPLPSAPESHGIDTDLLGIIVTLFFLIALPTIFITIAGARGLKRYGRGFPGSFGGFGGGFGGGGFGGGGGGFGGGGGGGFSGFGGGGRAFGGGASGSW